MSNSTYSGDNRSLSLAGDSVNFVRNNFKFSSKIFAEFAIYICRLFILICGHPSLVVMRFFWAIEFSLCFRVLCISRCYSVPLLKSAREFGLVCFVSSYPKLSSFLFAPTELETMNKFAGNQLYPRRQNNSESW